MYNLGMTGGIGMISGISEISGRMIGRIAVFAGRCRAPGGTGGRMPRHRICRAPFSRRPSGGAGGRMPSHRIGMNREPGTRSGWVGGRMPSRPGAPVPSAAGELAGTPGTLRVASP